VGQIEGRKNGSVGVGFAACPTFAAEFRRRISLFLFSTNKRQAPTLGRPSSFRVLIMTQDKTIEIEGTITSVLPGTMFHVALANNHTVLAHISGKMRKRFIRLLNGDRVKLEMSPYDLEKARIVYRLG
jgi:translation initiation factor IF-1